MREQKNTDNNLISLLKEFIRELCSLIREHIKLFKLEFARNTHKFIKAVICLVFAVVFSYAGLIFLGLLTVSLLSMLIEEWIALLLVTAVYFGVPLILLVVAVNLFYSVFKEPKKSISELEKTTQEAKQWMNNIKK